MADSFPPVPEDVLRRTAGGGAFARGAAYHAEGRVDLITVDAERAVASVRGTETYRVEVAFAAGRLTGRCDCPAFEDSPFCKHMVAVALAAPEAGAADRIAPLRAHLVAQGAEALAERILLLAENDHDLFRQLEREVGDATADDEALIARYRRTIDEATDPEGGEFYRGAGTYADGVDGVLASLAALAKSGRAAAVLGLVEHLIDGVLEGIEAFDDSEGEIFAVGDRAVALHLELCRASQPDPAALAERLFDWELRSYTDLCAEADEAYADVLGPKGLEAFARLAREAWARLPPKKSGAFDDGGRHTLKQMLDRAADRTGDLDARIDLRKAELAAPQGYVEIADILAAAGRDAEALKWLAEALWCFEDKPDWRLEQKAARALATAGRRADAEAVLWKSFQREPSQMTYRELRALPAAEPPLARASTILRAAAARQAAQGRWGRSAASTLFDIQLEEGAVDAAWETAEAHDPGEMRVMDLAAKSGPQHRARVVAACERYIEARARIGGNGNYDEAIKLVERRRALVSPADHAAFVAALLERHKAKRNFIARLMALR